MPLSIEGIDHALIELTPREAQLVDLAARALTNAEIGRQPGALYANRLDARIPSDAKARYR